MSARWRATGRPCIKTQAEACQKRAQRLMAENLLCTGFIEVIPYELPLAVQGGIQQGVRDKLRYRRYPPQASLTC